MEVESWERRWRRVSRLRSWSGFIAMFADCCGCWRGSCGVGVRGLETRFLVLASLVLFSSRPGMQTFTSTFTLSIHKVSTESPGVHTSSGHVHGSKTIEVLLGYGRGLYDCHDVLLLWYYAEQLVLPPSRGTRQLPCQFFEIAMASGASHKLV